jgi:Ulp1 family protease
MDFCFILTEAKYNEGHWTVLIRDGSNFEYFDSYGDSPKSILDFIPKYVNKQHLGDERERLVTASPVMTKSRAPARGNNYPENGLVKPP